MNDARDGSRGEPVRHALVMKTNGSGKLTNLTRPNYQIITLVIHICYLCGILYICTMRNDAHTKSDPIGVFDSGMGGLTVLKEIIDLLPYENTVYYSDAANCPYGPRSAEEVTCLSRRAVDFLLEKKAKIVVVACNTATAAAIDTLRSAYPISFIGMEPAVKPAALRSASKVIGILATEGTFQGRLFNQSREKYGDLTTIITQVGDSLVELVEQDKEDTEEALQLIRRHITPILEQGADNIVLGCTHYPFLISAIKKVIGDRDVAVIDPAPAIARRTKEVLAAGNLLNDSKTPPFHLFYSSNEGTDPAFFMKKMEKLDFR